MVDKESNVSIERAKSLASEWRKLSDETYLDMYFIEKLERPPREDEVNRAGCSPLGVDRNSWPKFDEQRMFHLVTLDLEAVPKVRSKLLGNPRALAVFISDPNVHEANCPGTKNTSLVYLDKNSLELGVLAENPSQNSDFREIEPCTFSCHEISLPKSIFDPNFNPNFGEKYFNNDGFDTLVDLYETVSEFSFIGGEPLWYHSNYYNDHPYVNLFLFQLNEEFLDINMGDSGSFFVFHDTAFCQ